MASVQETKLLRAKFIKIVALTKTKKGFADQFFQLLLSGNYSTIHMKTDYLKLQEGLTEGEGHVKKDGGVHGNYMMKKTMNRDPSRLVRFKKKVLRM